MPHSVVWQANVYLKDLTVNLTRLDPRLQRFLLRLGRLHDVLFERPLTVTSGNDGQHASGSKHYKNRAVDIRLGDLGGGEQLGFLNAVLYLARARNIAVFDERALGPEGHVHLELPG